ncbi:alpha/beta-tubulin-N-acetyltransferase 9 isoform X1 [Hyla sarda]|uniref:alpha/beta-tubulin-N-acetyltransferase 9 isoform X1 n=1 Tax=Hyla sarda TaxID=327740 RepID=UPI0024C42D41|nr:alpha/beta-tubulin-N-acetyltransferase 9 isoform X1 [Hyla sarda]
MRVNEDTVLKGHRVLLVPYEPHHVPRYHQWMKSEELQKLTASEPLTLDQEYDMQHSWREDNDKCTFIILDRIQWDQGCPEDQCMVGDVNLFLVDPGNPLLAEIEIMIAEPSFRGRGFGEESVRLMLYYGATTLGISTFQAKIGQDNLTSVRLFNRLHFKEDENDMHVDVSTFESSASKKSKARPKTRRRTAPPLSPSRLSHLHNQGGWFQRSLRR